MYQEGPSGSPRSASFCWGREVVVPVFHRKVVLVLKYCSVFWREIRLSVRHRAHEFRQTSLYGDNSLGNVRKPIRD